MCTGKTCHSKSPSGWWSRKKKVFHKGAFLCSQCRTLPINIGLWWCCFECWWLDAWPPQKTLIRHWWRFPVRAFLLFLLLIQCQFPYDTTHDLSHSALARWVSWGMSTCTAFVRSFYKFKCLCSVSGIAPHLLSIGAWIMIISQGTLCLVHFNGDGRSPLG